MSKVCVLLIDDEPDAGELFRQHFRRQIRSGELDLVFVSGGTEALEVLETGEPAVPTIVMSDIKMPGMSGIELLRRIRPRWPQLPVFMVSAFGGSELEDEVRDDGADGFFSKPVDFDAVGQLIQSRLEQE